MYKVRSSSSELHKIWSDAFQDPDVRLAAAVALVKIDPSGGEDLLKSMNLISDYMKGALLEGISPHISNDQIQGVLKNLQNIPYGAQQNVVVQVASKPGGIQAILDAADDVLINPRLLMENTVTSALFLTMTPSQKLQITLNHRQKVSKT